MAKGSTFHSPKAEVTQKSVGHDDDEVFLRDCLGWRRGQSASSHSLNHWEREPYPSSTSTLSATVRCWSIPYIAPKN